ncbi:MAG: hypothetical protein ABJH45_23920 [Paracoccaceae bacterium]
MTLEMLTQSQSVFSGVNQMSSEWLSKRHDVPISIHEIQKGLMKRAFPTTSSKETLK